MSNCLCFATLSAAGSTSGSIPAGTPAVVVEQFDTNSAVSAAVYVFTNSMSDPGHALKFKNGSYYWVIHPDHVSLEAAGAPADVTADCSPAMNRVLVYLSVTAAAALKLWERGYVLNSLCVAPTMPSNCGFSIIGRGQTVSRLLVPLQLGEGSFGAFSVQFIDSGSQYLYKDFSVLATNATGTNSGCGTAISSTFVTGTAPRQQHGGVIENLYVGTDGVVTGDPQAAWSYFSIAMDLTGTPRPFVFNTLISGCIGPAAKDHTDSSPRYLAQKHLVLDECYDGQVKACGFWHASTAIHYSAAGSADPDSTANVQGFSVIDTHIEGVKTGIFHEHGTMYPSENPGGKLVGCSVQFRDVGFDINNISKWRVAQNDFRNEWDGVFTETQVYDMRFRAADLVSLAQNTFAVGGNPARVNMLIDADTTVNHVAHAMRFLIDAHQFGDTTSGDGTSAFGISAIQITESATDIQIGASNQYIGPFSGTTVDDASGSAVALVGFPGVPGDPTQPGVVAPSSKVPAAEITALGSGSVPWPASFSLLHTIPQSGEPSAPASGWILYTDTDGNLKARFTDGTTIVTVASH